MADTTDDIRPATPSSAALNPERKSPVIAEGKADSPGDGQDLRELALDDDAQPTSQVTGMETVPSPPTQNGALPTAPHKSIPLPSLPTPPRRHSSFSVAESLSTVGSETLSEIPLDNPPAPIEKSPPQTPHEVERQSSDRAPLPPPHTPATPAFTPTTAEATHKRSITISQGRTVSIVLISSALETIAASKEAKRSQALRDSVTHALEMVKLGQGGDRPREIFEPLRLACETRNEKLMIASLDCITKLISYSFFVDTETDGSSFASPPPSPNPNKPVSQAPSGEDGQPTALVDLVVHTITSCHVETSPDSVSLQIVRALLHLVLSPAIYVHQSALLRAVRTVYNVFLVTNDPTNQMVAQAGLTQMVQHVFTRCRVGSPGSFAGDDSQGPPLDPSSRRSSAATIASEGTAIKASSPPNSSNRESFDDSHRSVAKFVTESFSESTVSLPLNADEHTVRQSDTIQDRSNSAGEGIEATQLHEVPQSSALNEHGGTNGLPHDENGLSTGRMTRKLTTNELFIKDAFLVFRALCKLTMKPLGPESERDPKSHAFRTKLLSLHLVLSILHSHLPVFVDPSSIIYSNSSSDATPFISGVKQYLCLSLSRNAVSPVPQVFELSVEIFWRVLSGLRTKLKKEIEVLFKDIFIPILEMRNSTLRQKSVIMATLHRLCQDPQALVDIYLNYDCDDEGVDNVYEHLMNIITKIGTVHFNTAQQKAASDPMSPALTPTKTSHKGETAHLSGTSSLTVPGSVDASTLGLSETQLKRQGLDSLVAVLKSLVTWATAPSKSTEQVAADPHVRSQVSEDGSHDSSTLASKQSMDRLPSQSAEGSRQPTPDVVDDPTKFENAKQKKTVLLEGIRKFNFKPKRGIDFLLENGIIPLATPKDIASFLSSTDGLNKASLGEYLGEGDALNIQIMHAFVDHLEFAHLPFVEALRTFLQAFRLPGESQKIDRFMLKFAERYIEGNPQTVFANADCAYVLAYATIMLNTDAHNPQVKRHMTKPDFIKNTSGINDGADLPDEFISEIYDEIQTNEIRMNEEVEAATPATGLANTLANVGRDLQKEAYLQQSNGIANKTEALFRTMMRSQRRSKSGEQFFSASHYMHVKPMFEVAWMPFLAGLSGPLQDTDDMEVVELCLEGFKNAIRIVCLFDLELERNAFVTTLGKFTFLNNLGEMKTKNMEAIKTLLDVAVLEGNQLKSSWREVLTCVSQLEHMQLINTGVDVPDSGRKRSRKGPAEELATESRSTHITVAADMVFSLSHYLSATAIVSFVRALCDVSWEEIQSSGLSQHPRLFSLQKLVDISYYNMNRIRLEWSSLWEILGDHFNKVCCHSNPHVGFFALDALRQLAMRFLEKEELPHFKFQKDFLKPFEYTMIHNSNPDIRDMVLQCLHQMIQARVQNMRSGWRTMFAVFTAASRVLTERVVNSAFEIVTRLNKDHFDSIVRHGSFADLTVCITDFCKVSKYQKIGLLAIAMLRGVIPVMLESSECALSSRALKEPVTMDDAMIKFWFPVLFGFYDIIMNAEDLEVRRLALNSLFLTLKTYGSTYPVDFWDTVCQELLFPIFAVLKSSQDVSRFSTQEDMSVWLSTTMIQALRDLIGLYTFYFVTLERFLDGLLDLLCVCICQENDTLARIGTSCLQQLLESNATKMSVERWERITTTFVKLFKTTTPHQLFDESLRVDLAETSTPPDLSDEGNGQTILPAPLSPNGDSSHRGQISALDRKRIFKQIIVKCVLQLLLIEMTNDLLRNEDVYKSIPPEQLLRLMSVLDQSYQFARMFNEDKELRTGLWKVGFMKHLPNLLKQESSSAATLVNVLLRMYYDPRSNHAELRSQVADRFLPLGLGVVQDYNQLRADTQPKNVAAWNPVVTEILQGFCRLDDKAFSRYLPATYPLVTNLLSRDVPPEVRLQLRDYYIRVGQDQGIVEAS